MGSHTTNSIVYSSGRLNCIGQDIYRIPSVLSRLHGNTVEFLDLSFNCISTLDELKNFPNLTELVLDNNNLNDSLEFPFNPNLQTLSLNKNCVAELDSFLTKVSKSFPNLRFLSLLGNQACPNQLSDFEKDEADYQRYRCYVLYRLPGLKFLDSRPVSRQEKAEASMRGKYMNITKLLPQCIDAEEKTNCDIDKYSPLPEVRKDRKVHQGVYGKCRYRYSGKNSEGNRFIKNHDL